METTLLWEWKFSRPDDVGIRTSETSDYFNDTIRRYIPEPFIFNFNIPHGSYAKSEVIYIYIYHERELIIKFFFYFVIYT
jgi:hypothetical protein